MPAPSRGSSACGRHAVQHRLHHAGQRQRRETSDCRRRARQRDRLLRAGGRWRARVPGTGRARLPWTRWTLKAQGLEVVSRERWPASPNWQRLNAASPCPLRWRFDDHRGPGWREHLRHRGAHPAGTRRGCSVGSQPLGSITSAIGAGRPEEPARRAGQRLIIEVSLRMHFAQLANGNRGFFGRLSDTAKVSAKGPPCGQPRRTERCWGDFKTALLQVNRRCCCWTRTPSAGAQTSGHHRRDRGRHGDWSAAWPLAARTATAPRSSKSSATLSAMPPWWSGGLAQTNARRIARMVGALIPDTAAMVKKTPWQRIKALFEALIDRPAAEHETAIDAALQGQLSRADAAELRNGCPHHQGLAGTQAPTSCKPRRPPAWKGASAAPAADAPLRRWGAWARSSGRARRRQLAGRCRRQAARGRA